MTKHAPVDWDKRGPELLETMRWMIAEIRALRNDLPLRDTAETHRRLLEICSVALATISWTEGPDRA